MRSRCYRRICWSGHYAAKGWAPIYFWSIPPGVDSLAPENRLIFALGPVTDTVVSGGCRYGVYTKYPQTGFYSESYSGGKAAEYKSRSSFDAFMIHRKKVPLPGACLKISPWVDLALKGNSWDRNAPCDALVNKKATEQMAVLYLKGKDALDLLASPVYGDLTMFPPLLIQIGATEALLDDALARHDKAKRCGVSSGIEIRDGMPHFGQFMPPILKEGRTALQQAAEFFTAHM